MKKSTLLLCAPLAIIMACNDARLRTPKQVHLFVQSTGTTVANDVVVSIADRQWDFGNVNTNPFAFLYFDLPRDASEITITWTNSISGDPQKAVVPFPVVKNTDGEIPKWVLSVGHSGATVLSTNLLPGG